MIAELIIFLLGSLVGYALGEPGRRKKVLAKLNDWTKPKKEPIKPEEPKKA